MSRRRGLCQPFCGCEARVEHVHVHHVIHTVRHEQADTDPDVVPGQVISSEEDP